jgi:hypothetical protein
MCVRCCEGGFLLTVSSSLADWSGAYHSLPLLLKGEGLVNTAGAVKTETSKKIRQKKTARFFFPDFFYMCCPCPFLQVDGVSLCLDVVLSSKGGI